jgi:hypothetical protein
MLCTRRMYFQEERHPISGFSALAECRGAYGLFSRLSQKREGTKVFQRADSKGLARSKEIRIPKIHQ